MEKEFAEPLIQKPVDGSLLAWYRGSGSRRVGTLLADLSGQKNNGTITFGTGAWKNTPLGHSILDFDGADTRVNTGSDFVGVTAITISLWMNMKSLGELNAGRIVSNGNFMIFNRAGGTDTLRFRSESLNESSFITLPTIGTWFNLAITRTTAGTSNFYVNGVLTGSADQDSGTPTGGTINVIIGANSLSGTLAFDGKLDDICIFNKVMTSNEAMKLYQETKHLYSK